LRSEPVLLVIDDIDHVAGAARILRKILDDCPGTRIIATAAAPSRQRGERVVRLAPLAVPAAGADPEVAQQAPAVALFTERAAAVDHRFELTPANATAVANLCRRLDGLPLAIELAAARSATLTPEAQLDQLDRGSPLDLHSRGSPGGPARHGELRTAIEWSHRLANIKEQVLFRRLGVFEGGCSLDALRDVCADPGQDEAGLIDGLMSLVDIHLVEPDVRAPEPRYRLTPTITEFAVERMEAEGELAEVTVRHGIHYMQLARRAAGLGEHDRATMLRMERDNLHAAFGRLVEAGDAAAGLRMAADLAPLWLEEGLFAGVRRWLDRLLDLAETAEVPIEIRAEGLLWSVRLAMEQPARTDQRAWVAERLARGLELARASGSATTLLFGLTCAFRSVFVTGDVDGAAAAAREGLDLARTVGDERWLISFEVAAGMVAHQVGDLEAAARLGAIALERAQHAADRRSIVRAGLLLHPLPSGTPGLPTAIPPYEELLTLCREADDVEAEGWVLANLTGQAVRRGDQSAAAAWSIEGLRLARRSGSWHAGGFAIVALVGLAGRNGDAARAARLHGSIRHLLPALQVGLAPERASAYLAMVQEIRQRAGGETFDRWERAGALLDWDQALSEALDYAATMTAAPVRRPVSSLGSVVAPGGVDELTGRESEVLRLLATGDTNKGIAAALGLTAKTVMHHSVSIYGKLGVRGRAEATAWAFRHGLADIPSGAERTSPLS
jgi:predicted ATPase/DNA-binding CsgD family transcriptional regulator